jgi:uncharacterized protein (DUF2062 family)
VKSRALKFRASLEDLTAEEIGLLLVVGFTLGVFPIMGCPTILCLIVGFKLRLNVPVLQLINNLTSPIQLALLLPFERAGAWAFGGGDGAAMSLAGKLEMAALHAVAGWTFICVPLAVLACAGVPLALRTGRRALCNGPAA